jgi:hypothetical protein
VQRANPRNWFADDEFEPCPGCKERAAIVTPDVGAVICTECGFVGFRAGAGGETEQTAA